MTYARVVAETEDQGLAPYLDRVVELVEDSRRTNLDLARRWGARSFDDGDWTVDTLMADALEAWDHLTPLVERGLDLWLEILQGPASSRDARDARDAP